MCVLESGTSSEPQLFFLFLKYYSSLNKTFNRTDILSARQNLLGLELGLVAGDVHPGIFVSPENVITETN